MLIAMNTTENRIFMFLKIARKQKKNKYEITDIGARLDAKYQPYWIFCRAKKGFYTAKDIDLTIVDPSSDDYAVTPAKKVELGKAHFALCPTESIISYRTKNTPFPLIAIAAILQEDLSAIVVKKDAGIQSPKDLDGKSYASYKARYEDAIVQQMIQNDGGLGTISLEYPEKLGIWDRIINGTCDATWIFVNWEGVEAAQHEIPLTYFKMRDYQIPYSYSPVIATNETLLETQQEAYQNFLSATKAGFLYAKSHPQEAVKILKKFLPEKDQEIDLQKALEISANAFGDEKTWGKIDEENITTFVNWIYDKKLETQKVPLQQLFTNQLLDS
jgi:ABC-type nitrate/sulfonate/bicarbonate transport system substrate-binding protein